MTANHNASCPDWGGFSWDLKRFPDERAGSSPTFVSWLESDANPLGHGLSVLLNGHPDTGIAPCEANYSAFCAMIGADPGKGALLPCNMSSAQWAFALEKTMLEPKGISWWWTDYGGCADVTWPTDWPLTWSAGCDHAEQHSVDDQGLRAYTNRKNSPPHFAHPCSNSTS